MFRRACLVLLLGMPLLAGEPTQPLNQAWVLALDGRGGVVGDLKPEEFRVKVNGKTCQVTQVKAPAQTADAAQYWVLVFEPIRDPGFRASAFLAAVDFLIKVPEGDQVLIVTRGKDALESLMPGFSARRGTWAEAMAKVPDLLPERLIGSSKERLQGEGFKVQFKDVSVGASGQEALLGLQARFRAGGPGWAKGTTDMKGVTVLQRLNFTDPMYVAGLVVTAKREGKALGSLFDQIAPVPGQIMWLSSPGAKPMTCPIQMWPGP